MNQLKRRFIYALFVVIGALCLMADAFYNGFPLFYSDTSTYIVSGFELKPPFDRPITYGVFLRIASLNGLSLWGVIFFQSCILAALLFLVVREMVGERFLWPGLFLIALLSAFTGLSWTVSQLMPDVFTPIGLLCLFLLLYGHLKRSTRILLYVLFFLVVAMHLSHVVLFGGLILILFVFRKYFLPGDVYARNKITLAVLFVVNISAVALMGAALSKSKHAFTMGTMVENGILKTYLDEYCGTKDYKLCQYKDSLPEKAWQFLWNEDSPFYKIGGFKETKTEFNEIIHATLTDPKYIGLHVKESLKATGLQLHRFAIGDGTGKFAEGTLVYERMSIFFPHEFHKFTSSKQYQLQLGGFIDVFNTLFMIVVLISLVILVVVPIVNPQFMTGNLRFLILVMLTGVLLNAWDCGTFANAIDRLGCKMMWLIPMVSILAIYRYIMKPGTHTQNNHS